VCVSLTPLDWSTPPASVAVRVMSASLGTKVLERAS